ncbi:MAG: hypothetical protein ACK5H0_10300 [Bacteroidota bacterium]|jgi:hypothetical protein
MTLKQLQNIIEQRKRVDQMFRDAEKVGVIDVNGPLFNAVWHAIESVTSIVDSYGWIDWFVYENEYGARELTVTIDGRKRKIKTIKQLHKLLQSNDEP